MKVLRVDVNKEVAKFINVRVPGKKLPGSHGRNNVFYVGSETKPGAEHIVRSRDADYDPECICSCQDFIFNRWAKHEECKHIALIETLATHFGGIEELVHVLEVEG